MSQESHISLWQRRLAWVFILATLAIAFLPTFDALRHDLSPVFTLRGVQFERLELGTAKFPLQKGNGPFLAVDLSSLDLAQYADDSPYSFRISPLLLMEDGLPLPNHTDYNSLSSKKPGSYTHWTHGLYFIPTDGGDGSGKTFTLYYPKLRMPIPFSKVPTGEAMWNWVIWGAAVGTLLLLIVRVPLGSATARSLFVLPVITYYFYQLLFGTVIGWWGPSRWEYFACSPDSMGWISPYAAEGTRPPVYPTFINLVAPTITPEMCLEVPMNTLVANRTDLPLLRVVHLQKTLVMLTGVIAAWALMALIPGPLVGALFLWICGHGFLTAEADSIMSEPLAQSWMFLIVAVFAAYLIKPRGWALVLLAFMCGLLYQTRSAGIFSFVIFGMAVLFALFKQPRYAISSIMGASILLGAIFVAPIVHRYFVTGFVTSAPMYADARIPWAIEFATKEDFDLMPDEISRQFLQKVFELKPAADEIVRVTNPPTRGQYLGTNLYQVAHPAAQALGLEGAKKREVFLKVSEPLLKRHKREQWELVGKTFYVGLVGICRFNFPPFPGVWLVFGGVLLTALVAWNRETLFAFALTFAHLAHLAIASIYDLPSPRNFHASEFLVLIAGLAAISGLARRFWGISALFGLSPKRTERF